jgi:hypothetical protein
VLIAILIILIAAVVIYMRVGIIMDYPSKMAGGEGNSYLPPIQDVLSEGLDAMGSQSPAEVDSDSMITQDTTSAVGLEQEPAEDSPADTSAPAAQSDPPPADSTPAVTVTPPAATTPTEVTITVAAGDVGSKIADKLLAVGAITDKAAFLAEVTAQGADTKLKQGTFTIPAGTTLAEIVKILVG